MRMFLVLLGVSALIRREGGGDLGPIPRDDSSNKGCEHRVFQVTIPSIPNYKFLQSGVKLLENLIDDRAISLDRDRNKVKKRKQAVSLLLATEQWKSLQKATEGPVKDKKGREKIVPFANFDGLKDQSVWGWFASAGDAEAPAILQDFLRGFLAEDYEKIADMVGELKWGKEGNVHLDLPSQGVGLSLWVLLPPKFVQALDADAKKAVKMRFSLVQISGQEALVEAVAETTGRERVKEVFQSNHFADCDKMMMNDLRDFIPSAKDEDSSGKLKDLFGGDDIREKSYDCIVPEEPFTPEISRETDESFKQLVAHAMDVPGGIQGIANKNSKYNNALDVSDKSGGAKGFFSNFAAAELLGFGESYTHGGDMFPRWYLYVMQQCAETSASSCPTCMKYNKAPGRWGPFVGANGLHKPSSSYLAIRSD